MKLLVFSDSHTCLDHMVQAVERENPDYLIHLGDHTRDAEELQRTFPMLPLVMVRGNCDYYDDETPELWLAEYGGLRVMMAHGHRYGVKSSPLRYELAARENQADIALFGHTHCALCEQEEGLWLVNPGSCGYCCNPTYARILIQNKQADCCIVSCDTWEELR